jgi:hypothetical protein
MVLMQHGARHAGEHLVRASEVELLDAGEEQEANLDRHVRRL